MSPDPVFLAPLDSSMCSRQCVLSLFSLAKTYLRLLHFRLFALEFATRQLRFQHPFASQLLSRSNFVYQLNISLLQQLSISTLFLDEQTSKLELTFR